MFMVSEKGFCLPQHKFPTVIQLITNKYIILIIWFYIFFQGILWCFSYPVGRIWEDLISLTTFIYGTDTNGVKNYMQLYAKNWSQWPKERQKEKCHHFPDFINSLWSIFSQMWSLSKHAKLNIYFLNLANPNFFKP